MPLRKGNCCDIFTNGGRADFMDVFPPLGIVGARAFTFGDSCRQRQRILSSAGMRKVVVAAHGHKRVSI